MNIICIRNLDYTYDRVSAIVDYIYIKKICYCVHNKKEYILIN